MTLDEIKKFLDENKTKPEIKSFLDSLSGVSNVKAYLENNDEGKKLLQSLTDAKVTQGIETFKKNNLDKLVEAKFNELHPPETTEQKRIRELEIKFNESESANKLEKLRNKALTILTSKNIKPDVLDVLVLGDDETALTANLEKFTAFLDAAVSEAVKNKFKENGREDRTGENNNSGYDGANPWKKETFNLTQQGKLIREKPEVAKILKAEAGY